VREEGQCERKTRQRGGEREQYKKRRQDGRGKVEENKAEKRNNVRGRAR
jgi:hypothetical protein